MKNVISISLGSKNRDHEAVIKLAGKTINLKREGVDGDIKLAKQRFEELDGKYDCFGAGGLILNFHVGDKFYPLRQAKKLIKNVHKTPVVDGTGIKDTIERNSIQTLWDQVEELVKNQPKKALVTSAVDRYGMAKSLDDAGFDLIIGDLMFGIGFPYALKSLKGVRRLSRILLPIMGFFPVSWLYPTGESQDTNTPKYTKHFEKSTIIAGDFLYTKKYSPNNLEGKIILTNTTTAADMDMLQDKGVQAVITTTPRLKGRSFGTNVLEAAVTAYAESETSLPPEIMADYIDKLELKPEITYL